MLPSMQHAIISHVVTRQTWLRMWLARHTTSLKSIDAGSKQTQQFQVSIPSYDLEERGPVVSKSGEAPLRVDWHRV